MNRTPKHQTLASGRWFELSLCEQMGNIGGEVHRAVQWQACDQKIFDAAVDNVLELIDLTIADLRWQKRLREILRVREFFCDAVFGENQYDISLEDLDHYFLQFAIATRLAQGK